MFKRKFEIRLGKQRGKCLGLSFSASIGFHMNQKSSKLKLKLEQ